MASTVRKGDRVIITTEGDEVYEGIVEFCSPNCVEIYNVFDRVAQVNLQDNGNMAFYQTGTKSIHVLPRTGCKKDEEEQQSDNQEFCSIPSSLSDSTSSISSSTSWGTPEGNTLRKSPTVIKNKQIEQKSPQINNDSSSGTVKKSIKLDPELFDQLKSMTLKPVYIDIMGDKFRNAIYELENSETIGVAGVGTTFDRGHNLNLLVFCTIKQVFIFDMSGGKGLNRLATILESKSILKVVHGGAPLYDCLYHKYGITMSNIFDTQVADSVLLKCGERDIGQCLVHYFNFPPSLLCGSQFDDIWNIRPIHKTDLIRATHFVVYLLMFRNHLLEIALEGIRSATITKYDNYVKMTDLEVLTKEMSPKQK